MGTRGGEGGKAHGEEQEGGAEAGVGKKRRERRGRKAKEYSRFGALSLIEISTRRNQNF